MIYCENLCILYWLLTGSLHGNDDSLDLQDPGWHGWWQGGQADSSQSAVGWGDGDWPNHQVR